MLKSMSLFAAAVVFLLAAGLVAPQVSIAAEQASDADTVVVASKDKPKKSKDKPNKDDKDTDPDDGNAGKGNDNKTLPNDGPQND